VFTDGPFTDGLVTDGLTDGPLTDGLTLSQKKSRDPIVSGSSPSAGIASNPVPPKMSARRAPAQSASRSRVP
jgi:hypothetical protein